MKDNSKIIGLALVRDAFRGIAHLGVLKVLEEQGFRAGFSKVIFQKKWLPRFTNFGMPQEEIRNIARNLRWLNSKIFTIIND